MSPENPRPYWQAMRLALDLGWMIVIPLVLLALAGRLADQYFDTSPWLLLVGMTLAMALTTILLVRKFTQLMNDLNHPSGNKPQS